MPFYFRICVLLLLFDWSLLGPSSTPPRVNLIIWKPGRRAQVVLMSVFAAVCEDFGNVADCEPHRRAQAVSYWLITACCVFVWANRPDNKLLDRIAYCTIFPRVSRWCRSTFSYVFTVECTWVYRVIGVILLSHTAVVVVAQAKRCYVGPKQGVPVCVKINAAPRRVVLMECM